MAISKKEMRVKKIWDKALKELDRERFHGFLCRVYGVIEINADRLTTRNIDAIERNYQVERDRTGKKRV